MRPSLRQVREGQASAVQAFEGCPLLLWSLQHGSFNLLAWAGLIFLSEVSNYFELSATCIDRVELGRPHIKRTQKQDQKQPRVKLSLLLIQGSCSKKEMRRVHVSLSVLLRLVALPNTSCMGWCDRTGVLRIIQSGSEGQTGFCYFLAWVHLPVA